MCSAGFMKEELMASPWDPVPDGTRIGAQLRAARLAARMSMAEVAEQAGLTKGFVSKLERDLANVSVASLIRLCDALGISVGSLFQAPKGEVVRRDARPRINFGGRKMMEYLLTPAGEKRVQTILSEIEPGGGSGKEPYRAAGRGGVRADPGRAVAGHRGRGAGHAGRGRRAHVHRRHGPHVLRRRGRAGPGCSGCSPPPCPTTGSSCHRPANRAGRGPRLRRGRRR